MDTVLKSFNPISLRKAAIVHDAIVLLVAYISANTLMSGLFILASRQYFYQSILFLCVGIASNYFFGLNRGVWRYASLHDLVAIIKAATVTIVVFTLLIFMFTRGEQLSRAGLVLTWFLTMFFLSAGRIAYRIFREISPFGSRKSLNGNTPYVLLYPMSDSTDQYIRAVRHHEGNDHSIVGIISETADNALREIQGKRVLGTPDSISEIVANAQRNGMTISALVITNPDTHSDRVANIFDRCREADLKVLRVPSVLGNSIDIDDNRYRPAPIRLQDILGRPENKIDAKSIANLINNQLVLVTGAGGSIGSELCRQIASFGPRHLILYENNEHNLYQIEMELAKAFPNVRVSSFIGDVKDDKRLEVLFETNKPTLVFHSAALKHVPLVEANRLEGIKTNVLGTAALADMSAAHGVRMFVLISTDKAVNPANIMGATKRAAETYCQMKDVTSQTHFVAVRFGNVLGSSGSVVPLFQKQIDEGGPVTVTHPDMTRFFMTIPEASRLVLQASAQDELWAHQRGKILVLDMGHPVKIIDLAKRMIQLAGLPRDKKIDISIVGLRAGEKLNEELYSEREHVEHVETHGYSMISPETVKPDQLKQLMAELKYHCDCSNEAAAIDTLRKIVPNYVPE